MPKGVLTSREMLRDAFSMGYALGVRHGLRMGKGESPTFAERKEAKGHLQGYDLGKAYNLDTPPHWEAA